jgi:hypothetical protein
MKAVDALTSGMNLHADEIVDCVEVLENRCTSIEKPVTDVTVSRQQFDDLSERMELQIALCQSLTSKISLLELAAVAESTSQEELSNAIVTQAEKSAAFEAAMLHRCSAIETSISTLSLRVDSIESIATAGPLEALALLSSRLDVFETHVTASLSIEHIIDFRFRINMIEQAYARTTPRVDELEMSVRSLVAFKNSIPAYVGQGQSPPGDNTVIDECARMQDALNTLTSTFHSKITHDAKRIAIISRINVTMHKDVVDSIVKAWTPIFATLDERINDLSSHILFPTCDRLSLPSASPASVGFYPVPKSSEFVSALDDEDRSWLLTF